MSEVHLELLLGCQVCGPDGKSAGRIHEILAEHQGGEWVVTEYQIGPTALLSRLSAFGIAAPLFRLLGADKDLGRRVPWDKLDLSDPAHPRLTCASDALPRLSPDGGKG